MSSASSSARHFCNCENFQSLIYPEQTFGYAIIFIRVRFEVFTAVTMKNGVFWDVTQCASCKNRRFGGT
jgi:hypothetical protein